MHVVTLLKWKPISYGQLSQKILPHLEAHLQTLNGLWLARGEFDGQTKY